MSTAWDLVVLDEVHHAAAATYKPLVEQLVLNSKRTLGFTGTLCRNEMHGPEHGADARRVHGAAVWLHRGGPLQPQVRALEDEGLIAKVRCMRI